MLATPLTCRLNRIEIVTIPGSANPKNLQELCEYLDTSHKPESFVTPLDSDHNMTSGGSYLEPILLPIADPFLNRWESYGEILKATSQVVKLRVMARERTIDVFTRDRLPRNSSPAFAVLDRWVQERIDFSLFFKLKFTKFLLNFRSFGRLLLSQFMYNY